MIITYLIFSSTGRRPEELMGWRVVRRPAVRPSSRPSGVNFFLVNTIETSFFAQSLPNLHGVFVSIRPRFLSIMGKIGLLGQELSALELRKVPFSAL